MALQNMSKHNLYITQTREPEHQKCDKPVGTGRYDVQGFSSYDARRWHARALAVDPYKGCDLAW